MGGKRKRKRPHIDEEGVIKLIHFDSRFVSKSAAGQLIVGNSSVNVEGYMLLDYADILDIERNASGSEKHGRGCKKIFFIKIGCKLLRESDAR